MSAAVGGRSRDFALCLANEWDFVSMYPAFLNGLADRRGIIPADAMPVGLDASGWAFNL